jgi:hypothetical protein
VIIAASNSAPLPVASTHLACPVCGNSYKKRKEIVHHTRTSTDEPHATFRYIAIEPVHSSSLASLGTLPCPLACGALFDGGSTCTSRPLAAHIARGTCRARRPGSLPLPREWDGPFMPTTTRGVTATLDSEVAHARHVPQLVPNNEADVTFCINNLDFTTTHMRSLGCQSAATMPVMAIPLLLHVIIDLLKRSHSTRGNFLLDAAHEALLLFPILVLGPQRPGASSSCVKIEVAGRLDL